MTIYFSETSKNTCLFLNVNKTVATAAKFRDTSTLWKILCPTKVLKFDAPINPFPRLSCFLTLPVSETSPKETFPWYEIRVLLILSHTFSKFQRY